MTLCETRAQIWYWPDTYGKLDENWEPEKLFNFSFPLVPSLSPSLLFPFSCVQSWANESIPPTVKLTYRRRQANRKNVPQFKTTYWDGVSVVYVCSSKYANLRWHVAWFSLWYPCVCWCELPGTRVLGGMVVCVCVCVNVGCHYLFLGIGWLSCLRTDGCTGCKLEECGAAILLSNLSSILQYRTITSQNKALFSNEFCQNKSETIIQVY